SCVEALDWARADSGLVSWVLVGLALALALLSLVAGPSRQLTVRARRAPLEWMAIGSATVGELFGFRTYSAHSPYAAALSTALCAPVLGTLAYARRARLLAYA